MPDYWVALRQRVEFIRQLYKEKRIPLKPGEGLTEALNEAEEAARGTASNAEPTDENLAKSVAACHVIWGLHDSISACLAANLDITSHLRQMTTGTIDFGVPADESGQMSIFFKDFEAELFTAAQLAEAGLPVRFLEKPNDPRGEMSVNGVLIEVKHPNSTKRLESLMRKFNGELFNSNAIGVFVTALEDAFCWAEQTGFVTKDDFDAWRRQKRAQMEHFGCTAVLRAAALPAIAGLVQTCTNIEIVAGETRLVRYSNSLVFDHRTYTSGPLETVERIAAVFNPEFRRYSQVRQTILHRCSTQG